MQETTFANYLAVTGVGCSRMICCMRLPFALAWLVDAAGAVHSADHFLASLGAQLIADGLPVAGGALTLTAPHPIIARRTWLWQAETGVVIEALGFGPLGPAGPGQGNVGRDWLAGLGTGAVQEHVAGPASGGPVLGWAVSRPLAEPESALLHQAARFAAAPLAVLTSRSTLAALLEAYLGRRGPGRHGASRPGARPARPAVSTLRPGPPSRRNAVGQYRYRRPAGLYRDRH